MRTIRYRPRSARASTVAMRPLTPEITLLRVPAPCTSETLGELRDAFLAVVDDGARTVLVHLSEEIDRLDDDLVVLLGAMADLMRGRAGALWIGAPADDGLIALAPLGDGRSGGP